MAMQQRIVRIRREYNQWVANQTLEDYALRFTARSARKWSAARVANTALGGISFLALEAIGHEGALPALGLAAEPVDQTMREHGSEITSYVVYGVTAELVRRLVRRWL